VNRLFWVKLAALAALEVREVRRRFVHLSEFSGFALSPRVLTDECESAARD
jgi:hypothetical protein